VSLAIHAFWGMSITFLFWGAMIRVTRNWAPPEEQGKAFGILETGRGLGEVLTSIAFLAVFAALGSTDQALQMVIIQFSVLILTLGVLAWFVLEATVAGTDDSAERTRIGFNEIISVLKMPVVWLIATVILTGYCAYWGLFRFTSYATDIFALSVTIGAHLSENRQEPGTEVGKLGTIEFAICSA